MKFIKDGYDYVSTEGGYIISPGSDCWYVFNNNEKIQCYERLAEAKEYCKKHYAGILADWEDE